MNSDIKILIKLFCFQEEIFQKNNINYKTSNNIDNNDIYIILIKKTSITKYKNFFNYDILYSFLKYKTNILDSIKENEIINYKKLNDLIISNIYKIIPKDYINKIGSLNKKKLLDELSEESEWKYKYIKVNKSNGQKLKLRLFDDFEIINDDLFKLFINEQKIIFKNLFFGNIIFGEKKIFVFIINSTYPIFEIGNFDENGNFNVEYLFNQKDINESNTFIEYLLNIGIDQILITIESNKEINFNNKNITIFNETNFIFFLFYLYIK